MMKDSMTAIFRDSAIQHFQFCDVLQVKYGLNNIILAKTLPGGYCEEETWLISCQDDRKYVVKTIQYFLDHEHLTTILAFQNYLHSKCNYPCAQIIPTSNDELSVIVGNQHYLFVQTFLHGHVPSSNELDKSYLSKMGTLLGQWCLASRTFLSSISHQNVNRINQQLTDQWWQEQYERLHRCCVCLEKSEIDDLHTLLSECQSSLNGKLDRFEQGLIHNDFQMSNTLYNEDNRQIYIIDFGEATYTYFIFDLATALFLFLTNGIDDHEKLSTFLTAYQQCIRLDQQEIEILDVLTRLKLAINFLGDCVNIKSRDEYENSSWLQSCSKWIRYLHQENRNLFIKILRDQERQDI